MYSSLAGKNTVLTNEQEEAQTGEDGGGVSGEVRGAEGYSEATPTPAGKREKPSDCSDQLSRPPAQPLLQQGPAPGALSSGAETPGQETP